jgi:UDP-2,3-diacylglucosamine hydrolase
MWLWRELWHRRGINSLFTLFISDLHLSEHTPELTRQFLSLLSSQAKQADALYILGDLFEMWVGDDHITSYNSSIIAAIKQLSNYIPVYFMAGNRDFMVGQQFARSSGCQILADPTLINLYGKPTLLTHGDFLCTQDKGHIAFRKFTQKSWVQKLLLSLPLSVRNKMGKGLREQSKQRNKRISTTLMDINQTALENMMLEHKVNQLIHGHTHRPSIHYFKLKNELVCHVVLNDWDKVGNALIYTSEHLLRLTTIENI